MLESSSHEGLRHERMLSLLGQGYLRSLLTMRAVDLGYHVVVSRVSPERDGTKGTIRQKEMYVGISYDPTWWPERPVSFN